jgi:type II secretory pathway component GspD/PulD (secretin)
MEKFMRTREDRGTRFILSAAALFASGWFASSGLASGVAAETTPNAPGTPGAGVGVATTASAKVERARQLLNDGKLVQARAVLDSLATPGGAEGLSDSELRSALDLRSAVAKRMRELSPMDVSIQNAEQALEQDEVSVALRQSAAVIRSTRATDEQKAAAQKLHDAASERRDRHAKSIPGALKFATTSIDAARYAEGKSALSFISRSGVELSGNDRKVFDEYQSRIVEMETTRGKPFDSKQLSLAAFDPGVVERRPQPTEKPAAVPATEDAPKEAAKAAEPPAEAPARPTEPELPPLPPSGTPKPKQVIPPPVDWTPTPAETAPPPAPAPVAPAPMASDPAPAAPAPIAPAPSAPVWTPPPAASEDPTTLARRLAVGEQLAEADKLFDESQFAAAVRKYTALRDTSRDMLTGDQINRIETRLSEARVRLGGAAAGNLLEREISDRQLAKQQAQAEYNSLLEQADAALAAGDTGKARELTATARVTIANARNVFSETELENLYGRISEKQAAIANEEERLRSTTLSERERAQANEAAMKAAEARVKKDKQIKEAIDRVRALQQERKYREALQVVDQILFLDPNNPAGLLLRDIIGDTMVFVEYNTIDRRNKIEFAAQSLENVNALHSPASLVVFPPDWPELSRLRGEPLQFAETPENLRVIGVLESKRTPIQLADNSLEDVIKFIRTVGNVNVDVDWGALETANVTKETPVSLSLTNVTLKTALDRVLEKVGDPSIADTRVGWAVEEGVLVVSTQAVLNKRRVTEIYDVRDLLIEVPNYVNAPEFDLNSVLQSGEGGGGQSPFQQNQEDENLEDRRTLQERAEDVIALITQLVDFDGWRENGGDTGFINNFQGSLIITNTAKNHREISGLLSKLRQPRSMQINVETRFLLVSEDFFEQIGFDLDVYFNANNNQVRAARFFDPTINAGDFFDFSGQGVRRFTDSATRSPSNVPIIRGGTGGTVTSAVVPVVPPDPWSPIGVGQGSLGLTETLAGQGVRESTAASAVLGASPALGIAGSFLDDIQVDFLVKATQADRRSVSLTAPRLTFTNGQISNIYVATQTAFISDLQPVVSESSAAFDPDLAVLSEGVRLLVEGNVSADRRYVTMNVDAAVARLERFGQSAVTAIAGGQLVNSADTRSFIQLPVITVTRVQTTVTVPDQGTILLGGQRLVNQREVESGVPILSKIPVINRLFSNRITFNEEQTLLILIKPTVLMQQEQEERNFPGLLDSLRTGIGG